MNAAMPILFGLSQPAKAQGKLDSAPQKGWTFMLRSTARLSQLAAGA